MGKCYEFCMSQVENLHLLLNAKKRSRFAIAQYMCFGMFAMVSSEHPMKLAMTN